MQRNVSISTAHLLQVWEQGYARQPHQAIMALLQATVPPEIIQTLGTWTIGERDRHLFQIREKLFGQTIECVARCPNCSNTAEFTLSTRNLCQPEVDKSEPLSLEAKGYRVIYRLPTLADLDAVALVDDRRIALLTRCILQVMHEEKGISTEKLPSGLLDEVVSHMDEADPQVYIQLDLSCPECGVQWQTPFDIVTYLWQELDTWAQRVQREVHIIATAYSWSEAEILQLAPVRRQAYIELILSRTQPYS